MLIRNKVLAVAKIFMRNDNAEMRNRTWGRGSRGRKFGFQKEVGASSGDVIIKKNTKG